jgi:hypothetical protein
MSLNIKNLSFENIVLYKNCFDLNDSPKEIELIQWQFLNSPINKQFVDILVDENNNKVAAIYAVFSVNFQINGESMIGCQSLDTITDIDYRGKGLFIKLAKDVYQKAATADVVLVYGFPNGNSIHGFKTKLGWEVLDPVPFLIKPLRSQYFTKRIPFLKYLPNINLGFPFFSKTSKKYKLIEDFSFPDGTNELWKSFSKNISISVQRNKSYLEWRYLKKPFEDYKIVHCYDVQNCYLGFVVYAIKEKHGGKIAYIMELIYDLDQAETGVLLLQYAIREIKKERADCVLSWCFEHAPNYGAFKKRGFFNLPEKFRPIELHFGASCLQSELENLVYNRKNWYISYSDSDTV